MDKIICGGFEWVRNPAATDNRIDGGSLFLANAIAQDELSIDTLEADIWSLCRVPLDFEPADYDGLETADGKIFCCASGLPDLTTIPYGTPVNYYRNNALIARLYKSEISRVGLSTYRLSAVSAIGLLDKLPHSGGLYTGQTAGVVMADIIGGAFAYTIAPEVASIKVFGWLPMATRRDNLRQLLFAVGASVRKSADGAIKFVFLSADAPTEIIGDRMYTGGSLAYNTPATGVDVTEHAYYATSADIEATLFDNTDGSGAVDHKTITFDKPCHGLTPSSGLTIHESGVNYAIASGTGTLTGKEYTHQTKIISRRLEADTENIVTVKDATLVSMANSGSVADRVLAYYSGAKTLSVPIVEGGERPGDAVYLEDAFGDLTNGLLQSMNIRISSTLRADTTIVTGYTPIYHGNDYNNRVLLTGAGTWTVPDGVTKAKVVLIGSGDGGTRGTNGSAGGNTTLYFPGTGSKTAGPGAAGIGGVGGPAGLGGKILEVDITLTPGEQIAYQAHPGGLAGQEPGEAGVAGQDTVFGTYTSASGERIDTGYIDRMTGDILGAKGTDGVAGGNGGTGASGGGTGGNGEDVQSWKGGTGNEGQSGTLHDPDGSYSIGGGAGGGAVYGSDGANAPAPGGAEGKANAGNGANASPHPENGAANYGTGGAGGNGGGGGGGAGQMSVSISGVTSSFTWSASGGTPGIASVARNGSPGCAVIYF